MNLRSKAFLCFLGYLLFLTSCTSINKKEIEYKTTDAQILKADLFMPREQRQKTPVVIVIHGGGWKSRTGDMEWICKELQKAGFAALSITYRHAPKFHYPVQLDDVKAVDQWLSVNALDHNLDLNNVFIWGYSAGAHLAFLLANQKDLKLKIKAIVVGGIPSYFPTYPTSPLITDFMGVKFNDNPQSWVEASPVTYVSERSPPTFIYHGETDELVELSQAEMLKSKLDSSKVSSELHIVSGRGHLMTYFFPGDVFDRALAFIRARTN